MEWAVHGMRPFGCHAMHTQPPCHALRIHYFPVGHPTFGGFRSNKPPAIAARFEDDFLEFPKPTAGQTYGVCSVKSALVERTMFTVCLRRMFQVVWLPR